MGNKMIDVQKSLYQKLSAFKPLTSKVNGIYDYVPEKAKTPYANFGELSSEPLETKVEGGEKIDFDIEIWSESKGRTQALEIINLIEDALKDDIPLPTEIFLISQKITSRTVIEHAYGLYHGTVTVQFQLEY